MEDVRIVRQTKNNTCMACVMAMIVGETEQYVLDWFKYNDPPFSDEDVLIFLAHHGVYLATCAVMQENGNGQSLKGIELIQPSIDLEITCAFMVVDSQTKGQTHAVFWDTKHILDPQKDDPQKITNYAVRFIYPILTTEERRRFFNISNLWNKEE